MSTSRAQTTSTPVAEFPRFRLIRGNVDSDGLPISGAKLCLLKLTDNCYVMPSNTASSGSVAYEFGLDPLSERLILKEGGSLVFFWSRFSGGGSGTLDRLAILRYEPGGKIVNLLPYVCATNQSDRAIWNVPKASNFPVLLTADFDWMDGETHFSPHFYFVNAYRFDAQRDRYTKVFSYRTSKKYPGLDNAEHIRVLEPERAEILKLLENGV